MKPACTLYRTLKVSSDKGFNRYHLDYKCSHDKDVAVHFDNSTPTQSASFNMIVREWFWEQGIYIQFNLNFYSSKFCIPHTVFTSLPKAVSSFQTPRLFHLYQAVRMPKADVKPSLHVNICQLGSRSLSKSQMRAKQREYLQPSWRLDREWNKFVNSFPSLFHSGCQSNGYLVWNLIWVPP